MSLDTCIMVYAYHYCILQSINILIVLKTLCAPSIQLLYLVPTDKYWYFLLSTKFCFSRIPYAWNHMIHSLLNWLLSFSNIHLRFLHIFSWLESSFLLNNIELSGPATVYPLMLKDILVASKFCRL